MNKFYRRLQEVTIEKRLKVFRVVMVNGPRQCGKTTLISRWKRFNSPFISLDDNEIRAVAQTDAKGLLNNLQNQTVIIDEIQKAKNLISTIKMLVDHNNAPGQFLLSGSVNIQSQSATVDSLAGRVAYVRMRTLTVSEILGKPFRLDEFIKTRKWPTRTQSLTKSNIIDLALTGGYPEALTKNDLDRRIWHENYLWSLFVRDLQDASNLKKVDKLQKLAFILSAWSSKQINKTEIGCKLGLKYETLEEYINALSLLYLFDEIPAYWDSDYDRVGKLGKIFCTDSGLMASMLGWNKSKVADDSDKLGKLMETFIYNQVAVVADLNPGWTISHYRDKNKREIDLVVENDDNIIGIEVKASEHAKVDDAKHLRWFSKNIKLKKPFLGMVLYAGEKVLPLGENIWALPMAILWS
jgi:predicted AAA+ superfamily ATPase